jgi:hypothetical protein
VSGHEPDGRDYVVYVQRYGRGVDLHERSLGWDQGGAVRSVVRGPAYLYTFQAAYDPGHAYDFGLQVILDGLAALIDQPPK